MSGKQTPDDNHEVNPHREHLLYSYYADELLANAEATKAQAKTEQVENKEEQE